MKIENTKIANLRVDYALKSFDEEDLIKNPFSQFDSWFKEALEANVNEPNAMTLATATKDGLPSARMVLLKGFDENGFVFYTNYNSHKSLQIAENPNVAIVFCWLELQRQIRIEGTITKTSEAQSDEYFHSRPKSSQIGAIASNQSSPVKNRLELEDKFKIIELSINDGVIKRPINWGGFIIKPSLFEFWQGRQSRLHDRFLFESETNNNWIISRLAP